MGGAWVRAGSVAVTAVIPTRGLIGLETDLVNLTKGVGIMSHLFREYGPHKGEIPSRNRGVLVAMEGGISTAYALNNVQERGRLFIGAQETVYEGMIVGENARPDDIIVEFDGEHVRSARQFWRLVQETKRQSEQRSDEPSQGP